MKAQPHGNRFQITYRCTGYPKLIFETFDTLEEANLRIAEILLLKKQGKLTPPLDLLDPDSNKNLFQEAITVRRLMDEYVRLYGTAHWSAGTMSCNLHRINDYILPYIGDYAVKDLTTHRLEHFYQLLLSEPAKHMTGHHDEKQRISVSVVERVHAILRSALNQAIRWGYLDGANPAMAVELPKIQKKVRAVWTADEAKTALDKCEDPILKLCMLLAIGCSMRIGEILGLTWDCVHISDDLIEKNECYLYVNKELRRSDRKCLEALEEKGRSDVQFTFPSLKVSESTTVLVLNAPKTESSVRRIYLPNTLALILRDTHQTQEQRKKIAGTEYQDFNLVIAQDNGRPYEERLIAKMFKSFIQENNLPLVVFHSLRHCSTGLKLRLSGGDIKAVQGDTGHAQANMVTDVYSHIMTDDRIRLAQNMESQFFAPIFSAPASSPGMPESTGSEDSSISEAFKLLKDSPEMAKAFLQMAQLMSGNHSSSS